MICMYTNSADELIDVLLCMNRYMLLLCYFRVDKKRDKQEKKILDSQERAFWDLHRPAVSILYDIHVFVSK